MKYTKKPINSDNELANELTQDIRQDALENAQSIGHKDDSIAQGKKTSEIEYKNFTAEEIEFLGRS